MTNLFDTTGLVFDELERVLDQQGHAIAPGLIPRPECERLGALFDDPRLFRSTVNMSRRSYGDGSYKYFASPVPKQIATLRSDLYSSLLPTARRWQQWLRTGIEYPDTHDGFLDQCAEAGQERPTPLLLRYEAGGHNRLHQDRYGEVSFPLQAVVMLSHPDDFEGGEFVLVEQRPRQQSRARVIKLGQGDMLIFANNQFPGKGSRGYHRVTIRHGVADIDSGTRRTLGLILHDAK